MEKKKRDRKFASITSQEAKEPNELLLMKEDQNHSCVGLAAGKNATSGISSPDNAPSLNQQFQPVVQWPQSAMEQSPLFLKPCLSGQSPSATIPNQWQLLQHQQLNPATHQVQHSQPPPHLAQPAMPFWLAQRTGYHLSGVNAPASYQPFNPDGTTDIGWQGPAINGGGTSARNEPQIPSFCYPYPGFPGPWDPTSWWGQAQPTLPPCTYTFPGAFGYISSRPPPLPGCSAASGQSFRRGIILPPAKLSQKHQQLWEAQSAENVQLWAVIVQLQSELADYKSRLMKLESKDLSLKPTVEETTAPVSGTSLARQSSKRGRPKKPIASVDTLSSPGESRPRARGRKPAPYNVLPETRDLNIRKERLKKVKQKENCSHSTIQHQNDGNIANILTNCCSGMEISGTNSHNQIHQDVQGVGLCSSSGMDNKNGDSGTVFPILTRHVEGVETKGASANIVRSTSSENFVWNSNIPSEDCGRDLVNMSTQGYYNDVDVTGQGRNVLVGWSFGNEEGASVGLQNAAVESAKDEAGEEMEDDDSSGTEDIA